MTEETARRFAEDWIAAWNGRDLDRSRFHGDADSDG
jgi:hypothetical protein